MMNNILGILILLVIIMVIVQIGVRLLVKENKLLLKDIERRSKQRKELILFLQNFCEGYDKELLPEEKIKTLDSFIRTAERKLSEFEKYERGRKTEIECY